MLEPIQRNSIKSGFITEKAVGENDFPKDAVVEVLNFEFDTIGQATLRKGTTILGNNLSGSILGLYQFIDSIGANNQIITVKGTDVYYLTGESWSSKRTVTDGQKARFSTFLNYVFMVNGADATVVWDGNPANGFLTTGNAENAPKGKYIENYRARMWIAGNSTYPDRLYYSSLPSAITTPIVSWDTNVTTGQWIDISPSDGENITALHRTKDCLLAFKHNHIYKVFSVSQSDPDPKYNVGTYSQESIVEAKNGVYFFHPTGFYRYNGEVQEISKPIRDFVENITLTNYSKVSGVLEKDGDHIQWSVGDITTNGISYSNVVLRYTISTQVWTIYSYPTQHLVSASYNDGSTLFSLVGDESGNILKLGVGNTDNGTAINYLITHPYDNIDGLDSSRKTLNKMLFLNKGMTGANINYQIENDVVNDWTKKIGQIKQGNTGFSLSIKGNRFKFRISGVSKGEPIIYKGWELLGGENELITFI